MKVRFCVECGDPLKKVDDTRYVCSNNHDFWNHPKSAAAIFPVKDGKYLLGKRGQAPQKGKLSSVGGFVNYMEDVQAAAIRETKEETGLDVKIVGQLNPVINHYRDDTSTVCSLFVGEIVGGTPKPNDDVSELLWFSFDETPELDFAWPWLDQAIAELTIWYKNNK